MSTARAAAGRLALIILGSHRSGMSTMARALSLAGAVGPTGVAPELGRRAPADIGAFGDRTLQRLDSAWDDLFGPRRPDSVLPLEGVVEEARELIRSLYGDAPLIVVQEPRLSQLTDLVKTALREEGFQLAFLIPVRNPLEVAASLKASEGFTRNRSLLLWTSYMLAAERGTRGERRVFVGLDALLEDPEAALDRIERKLAFRFPRRTWESATEIEAFLRAELKSVAKAPLSTLNGPLAPVRKLYDHLQAAAEDAPENEDVTSEVASWFQALEQTLAPVLKQLQREGRLAQDRQREELEAAQAALSQAAADEARELQARLEELANRAAQQSLATQAELEGIGRELDQRGLRVTELEGILTEARTEREGLAAAHEEAADAARREIADLRVELDAAGRRSADAETAYGAAVERERRIVEDAASAAEQRGRQADALQAEVVALRLERDRAHSAEIGLTERLAAAVESEAGTRAELAGSEEALAAAREQDRSRLDELERSLAAIDELEEKLGRLRRDAEHDRAEAEQAARRAQSERDAELSEALDRSRELSNALEAARKDAVAAQMTARHDVENLRNLLAQAGEAAREALADAEAARADADARAEAAAARLLEAEAQSERLRCEFEQRAAAAHDELTAQIDAAEARAEAVSRRLEAEAETLRLEAATLQARLHHLIEEGDTSRRLAGREAQLADDRLAEAEARHDLLREQLDVLQQTHAAERLKLQHDQDALQRVAVAAGEELKRERVRRSYESVLAEQALRKVERAEEQAKHGEALLKTLRIERDQAARERDSAKEAADDLRRRIGEADRRSLQRQEDLRHAQMEVARARDAESRVQEEARQAHQHLEEGREAEAELTRNLLKAQQELSEGRDREARLHGDALLAQEQVEQARNREGLLQREVERSQEELAQARGAEALLQQDIERLQSVVESDRAGHAAEEGRLRVQLAGLQQASADAAERAAVAEHERRAAKDEADARVTVIESALAIARRRSAETEGVLQQRIVAAHAEARDARVAFTAREAELRSEHEAVRRDDHHAADVRLNDERRRYADEDAALRDRLAATGLAANVAQTRARELQARLDAMRVEVEERRNWWRRLFGRS